MPCNCTYVIVVPWLLNGYGYCTIRGLLMCFRGRSPRKDIINPCITYVQLQGKMFLKLSFLYQLVNNLVIFPSHNVSYHDAHLNTRSANSVQLVRLFCRTESYNHSFQTIHHWNQLFPDIKSASSLCSFKYCLNQFLF